MKSPGILEASSLPGDTAALARFLIGARVCRRLPGGLAVGRIVETEAYVAGDAASHAFRGRTPRNAAMFLKAGHAYVYLAYGTSFMLNVSSGAEGQGEAVLIRALEPEAGAELMAARRGGCSFRDLARGPGRLAMALDIDRGLNGANLCAGGDLWLAPAERAPSEVGVSVRIGITKAADLPLRFYERGSLFVSGPRALSP